MYYVLEKGLNFCFQRWVGGFARLASSGEKIFPLSDGAENLKDLIHLAQYVAGWQGIVLH